MMRRLELVPFRNNFFARRPGLNIEDKFFNDNWVSDFLGEEKNWVPAFDVAETENEFVIKGEIPGIEAKDLDITLSEGILTIKGEKKHNKEEDKENYHFIERHYGSFHRSFRVPDNVKTDGLDASYKDGIVKITLPKSEEVKPKKIEVKEDK